jgi:hypothetical protein
MQTVSNPFRPGAQYVPPNRDAGIYSNPPKVRFLSQAVQPPSSVYVELGDVMRISAASSQANEALTVTYRLLLPNGLISQGQTSFAVTSDGLINIHDEPLAEGFLLSVSCKAAAAVTRGQTFARIFLTAPELGQGQPSYMLMADYVTTRMAPAHPNGRQLAPTEGPGWIHSVQFSNPARGANWGSTAATNFRNRVLGVSAILTTSATPGNRVATLIVLDNLLDSVLAFNAGLAQPPSTAWRYNWTAAPMPPAQVETQPQVGLPPDFVLPPGWSVESLTSGMDVNPATGDFWISIIATYESWLDNV